jgi:hypothetical protein
MPSGGTLLDRSRRRRRLVVDGGLEPGAVGLPSMIKSKAFSSRVIGSRAKSSMISRSMVQSSVMSPSRELSIRLCLSFRSSASARWMWSGNPHGTRDARGRWRETSCPRRIHRDVLHRGLGRGPTREAVGVRPGLRIERLEATNRPVPAGDRDDVVLFAPETELFVLERAHLGVPVIEARDVLLRLLCRDAELQRERARPLTGERREVDDLAIARSSARSLGSRPRASLCQPMPSHRRRLRGRRLRVAALRQSRRGRARA